MAYVTDSREAALQILAGHARAEQSTLGGTRASDSVQDVVTRIYRRRDSHEQMSVGIDQPGEHSALAEIDGDRVLRQMSL